MPTNPPPHSQPLQPWQIVIFGLPLLVGAAMSLLLAVFIGKFYIDVVLMPAGIMAIAIVVGRAFDAITDPLMGWVSDHTRSRFGRRKPWIAIGVLGNTAMFYLLLTPPADLDPALAAWWGTAFLIVSFLFLTLSAIPRTAFAAELTLDTLERQSLFGGIAALVAIGALVGALLPTILAGMGIDDQREQMRWQATLYSLAYLGFNALFLMLIKERADFIDRGRVPFVPGIRRAWRNKPFRIMFSSHIITAIPIAMPATLLPFYVQYVLGADEAWIGYYLLAYLISGLVCLPLWLLLAESIGKRKVWLIVSGIAVVGGFALFFADYGDTKFVLIIVILVGSQSAAWLFLGGAMHADVIDYDELRTGARREAQFSALWAVIPKFALIPGAALPLAILGSVGYEPNEAIQSENVTFTMKLLFSAIPALLNAIGLSLMYWYPLSEQRHRQIRDGVAAHAIGKPAIDPITGQQLQPPGLREVDEATAWRMDYFSGRELRLLSHGNQRGVVAVIALKAALLMLATVATGWLGISGIDSIRIDPGPLPAIAITAAGLLLAFTLYHLARLRPALQLTRNPLPSQTIAMHLRTIKQG